MNLEAKIEELEKKVARQHRFNLLLVMAAVALVFGGAVHGAGGQVMDLLKVREIQVINDRGGVAGVLGTREGGGFLDLRNRAGASGFIAHGSLGGGRMALYNARGKVTTVVAHKNGSPLWIMKRESDPASVILGLHRSGPVMTFKSPLGKTLFYMGMSDDRQKMLIDLFNLDGVRVAGLRNDARGNGLVEACNTEQVCQSLSPRNAMAAVWK